MKRPRELRGKLAAAIVLPVAVWVTGGLVGLPSAFRLYFAGYALVAVPFFALLDRRFTARPRRGVPAILAVFLVASGALVLASRLLPQYDPKVEQEKIARLQRSFLERQKPQRIEALRKEARELGLSVAEPGQVAGAAGKEPGVAPSDARAGPAAAAPAPAGPVAAGRAAVGPAPAGPSAELVARGKQAYEDWECYNCHKIGGKGGVKRRGPELDNVGNVLSPDAIRAEIFNPTSSLAEGFEEEYDKVTMPDDYGKRMSGGEVDALAAYLSALTNASVRTPRALFPGPAKGGQGPFYEIPIEYQKAVPKAWWTDPEIIARGKALYEGQVHPDVVCAACHGRDGSPVLSGASDFRNPDLVEQMSDAYWYWRIARGAPGTAMTAWEEKLKPEEILTIMVYENTFANGSAPAEHALAPPRAKK